MRRAVPDERNPVTRWRLGLGIKTVRAARILGVDPALLSSAEGGHTLRLRPTLREAFDRLGVDSGRLAEEYDAWQQAKRAEELQQFHGGIRR